MRIRYASAAAGFTLVELVVVLAVLAIAASLVTLSITAKDGYALESVAERLAASLETTRWQAISTGRRAAWEAPSIESSGASGSLREAQWYEQAGDGRWQRRLSDGGELPHAGLSIRLAQPPPGEGAAARLVLGPEPVGVAACILLTLEGATVAVVSDGVAPFAVRRDARC